MQQHVILRLSIRNIALCCAVGSGTVLIGCSDENTDKKLADAVVDVSEGIEKDTGCDCSCETDTQMETDKTKEIRIIAHLKIHEGKFDELKDVAGRCIQTTREKDNGTLQYDWFFNADQTEVVLLEWYKDFDALGRHTENMGELLTELADLVDGRLETYGYPSPEFLQWAELNAELNESEGMFYRYYQGL